METNTKTNNYTTKTNHKKPSNTQNTYREGLITERAYRHCEEFIGSDDATGTDHVAGTDVADHEIGKLSQDYYAVRQFFVDLGEAEFTYARWDWMITHSYLDHEALPKIRLWLREDKVVGLATFDTRLGTAYCMALPEFAYLKGQMLTYARDHLRGDKGEFSVAIADTDPAFQLEALKQGFVATPNRESDAAFYCTQEALQGLPETETLLPPGFSLVSMADRYDPYEYRRVLWRGFNHEINGEGELVYTEVDAKAVALEMRRPNVDLNLKLAVVSPEGHFVSYCGMWFDEVVGYSVIEPVATDPDYRKLGLGKAVVLEGIKRTAALGAKKALVGSSQQFYYSIGMVPYQTATLWKQANLL